MAPTKLDLHKNTISEIHENLMVYYELIKDKQYNHKGNFANIVTRLQLPHFTLSKDIMQDRSILREIDNGKPRNWGGREEWRDYMISKGYNSYNTKMDCVDHGNIPTELLNVLNTLPIKHPVFTINVQPPGSTIPTHVDTWRLWCEKNPELAKKYTFEDTKFFVVFLTSQEIGHSFQCENFNVKWREGDVVQIPYYARHATANSGFTNKILIQCLGIN